MKRWVPNIRNPLRNNVANGNFIVQDANFTSQTSETTISNKY